MMTRKQDQILLGPPKRKRGVHRVVTVLVLLLAAGAAYPHLLARRVAPPLSGDVADAILVFTGGEGRIAAGYRTWKEGKGKELFLLGAGPEAKLASILPEGEQVMPDDLPRIHIEGWSENTLENAISAKSEVISRMYRKVILVTSDYHVPRAHLTLRKVLPPTVSISVIPVTSAWGRKGAWHRLPRIFFLEGWKYWGYRFLLPRR
jgi:uncharacterized SAM-binding protein YcdF (DUF218 family)